MRTKDNLKLMEEITILNQFLYMDENNYVEFKNGDFVRILKINENLDYIASIKNSLFLEKSKEIQFQANFVFTDSNCDFKSTSFIFDTKDKSFTLNNRFLSTNHQPIDAFASAFHQAISSS